MSPSQTRAWDGFTRLFHWLLVASILFAWGSAEFGSELGDAEMKWHQLNGFFLLSLLIMRIIWGFAGSSTARFRFFLRPPNQALAYLKSLRSDGKHYLSHNPAGGWMVFLFMLVIPLQIITGLFSSDDIFVSGPLASLVESETSEQITGWHETLFNLILIMAVIHIVAVLYHQFTKREKLVQAMFTGHKPPHDYVDTRAPLYWRSIMLPLLLWAGIFIGVYLLFNVWL